MPHIRQTSLSSGRSSSRMISMNSAETDQWTKTWRQFFARDLVESQVLVIDAETSVEDACETLLSNDASCLAIRSSDASSYIGLFDYSDVNAFLVLAATRRKIDECDDKRAERIISAATAGHVPIHLVSNLSDKNPLEILSYDADIISMLTVFSRGAHRVLIRASLSKPDFLGVVSDRRSLAWFAAQAQHDPAFMRYLSNPLTSFALPSMYLYSSVVAVTTSSSVLDAMTLMSDEGVSSVAVIDEELGNLLSAISVTDIGKIVIPSEKDILVAPVLHLVARIKEVDGATDGADRYPVYSVLPSINLFYTIQKLLATNAHRLFVIDDWSYSPSSNNSPNPLSGIVSIVDILSLFAVIANVPDVDPTRMQRHRRASSATSTSSSSPKSSPRNFCRSRSNSRTSVGKPGGGDSMRSSISSSESYPRR